MNTKFSTLLRKTFFLLGALSLGWAAKAQSTTDSTTHRQGMHHRWGNRNGNDSLIAKNREGFHRGQGNHDGFHRGTGNRNGGKGSFAYHRPGANRFGHGRMGHNRGAMAIHYTPEQRKQVAAINKEYRQRSADLFKKDNSTLREYKAGLLALQKEKKSKLEGLLTQKQKDERTASNKRRTENAQVMAAARMERLKLRLGLSDEQVAKIKAGQESLHSELKAIHGNDNLLPQQKMEQLKALMAKRTDTYKSVLTPEQFSQFEKMSHHRPGFNVGWQGRS